MSGEIKFGKCASWYVSHGIPVFPSHVTEKVV